MKQAEFEECTRRIGWSLLQTAKRLNVPEQSFRKMVQRDELPPRVALYLRTVAAVVQAVPVPEL
jgi:hypothetical protein